MTKKQRNTIYKKALAEREKQINTGNMFLCHALSNHLPNNIWTEEKAVFDLLPEFKLFTPKEYNIGNAFPCEDVNTNQFKNIILDFCIEMTS